jgi:hypothetical protein
MSNKTTTLAPIASLLLSFLASSHHWLHMGILFVLGGSTGMMHMMSSLIWVRRLMLIMSLAMMLVSLFRMYKHRCRNTWIIGLNVGAALFTLSFITYTLIEFGW